MQNELILIHKVHNLFQIQNTSSNNLSSSFYNIVQNCHNSLAIHIKELVQTADLGKT